MAAAQVNDCRPSPSGKHALMVPACKIISLQNYSVRETVCLNRISREELPTLMSNFPGLKLHPDFEAS